MSRFFMVHCVYLFKFIVIILPSVLWPVGWAARRAYGL